MEVRVADSNGGGSEPVVLEHLSAEPRRGGRGGLGSIALDCEIEVHGRGAAQLVSHRTSNEVRGRQALERRQQVRVHHPRTGMPAARIASLASRTVYSP